MDKKSTFIGVLLLVSAFGLMTWNSTQEAERARQQQLFEEQNPQKLEESATENSNSITSPLDKNAVFSNTQSPSLESSGQISISKEEKVFVLENDYIRILFTSKGGAIKQVSLKKYTLTTETEAPYEINKGARLPALALTSNLTDLNQESAAKLTDFTLIEQTPTSISFSGVLTNGLTVERSYQFSDKQDQPYLLKTATTFTNAEGRNETVFFQLGSLPPEAADKSGLFMNVGYHENDSTEFINLKEISGSKGFLGIGSSNPVPFKKLDFSSIIWGSVKNQFFSLVFTPDIPASSIFVTDVELTSSDLVPVRETGISGALGIRLENVPGDQKTITGEYYIGPKEFKRLDKLGASQSDTMQFGFFGWVSKPLLVVMGIFYHYIGNWGVAIILLTVLIKLIFWPLTSKGIRSQKITGKKMSFLQKPMKEIREKHKKNPQKMNMEIMELYKKHKVNPAGMVTGCIPLIIQMPIFFGLFRMLQSASELRFAEFLWVSDLSQPDQLFYIGGFPFNLLPIIMTFTTYLQMRMTPTPTGGDEQQQMIQKMMRFMPFIFLFVLYNFAAGLALYWTSNNILSILQTYFINKRVQPELDRLDAEQEAKELEEANNKKKKKNKKK